MSSAIGGDTSTLTLHLDTSLQLERFKEPKKAQLVNSLIENFAFTSTSTYARREFKAGWLQDFAFLHKLSWESAEIVDVYSEIINRLFKHPRRQQRCDQIVRSFLARQASTLPKRAELARFREHLAQAILAGYDVWCRSVDYEYDGSACRLARERPRRAANGLFVVSLPHCRRTDIRCRVHEFFKENKGLFRRLAEAIEGEGGKASDELQKTAACIRAADKDPKYLCQRRNCWLMADAIIAVDGKDASCFGANNDREWKLLADVLGKQLVNPLR